MMRTTVIFAHYDKNNSIQNYVIRYLAELKRYFSQIVFVSDSDVRVEELKKIENLVDITIVGRHGEYDFGSYKKGYLYLLDNNLLEGIEELAFVNDSCYAPIEDFSCVFEKMNNKKDIDFWGLTVGYTPTRQRHHIQSYFMIFKSQVFQSDAFKNFMLSIKKELNKREIVTKYEMELTSYLASNGFRWDVYSQISKMLCDTYLYHYKELIRCEHFPLLKRSILLQREANFTTEEEMKDFLQQYSSYDFQLIQEDVELNKSHNSFKRKCWLIASYTKRQLADYYWDYVYLVKSESFKTLADVVHEKYKFNLVKLIIAWIYWYIIRPIAKYCFVLSHRKLELIKTQQEGK